MLLAPASGVVVGVEAEVGAVLTTGATVVRLAHDSPQDVVFTVPEDQLPAIRALVGKPGAVRVRAWGTSTLIPATVRELAAAADPATRTYLAKAGLGATPVQLGQTMTVLVDLPRGDFSLKLPLTALPQQAGQTAVWVLDKTSMTVGAQTISVAGADGNSVVVASGVQSGQIVVTAAVHTLSPGQRVKFYEVPAPPAAVTAVLPAPAEAASR